MPELLLNSPTPGTREQLTTLELELSEVATEMTWVAAPPAGLHGPGQFRVIIDHEIILCEAGESKKVKILERGAEGFTKAAHAAGAKVYVIMTRGSLVAFLEEITVPVAIKPTSNTNALLIESTIESATINTTSMRVKPTFTGSGDGAQGLNAQPIFKPSANVTVAYANLSIAKGEPPAEVKINKLIGGFYRTDTGSTEGTVSETWALHVERPTLGSIKPLTTVGAHIGNQGEIGVTTAVGLEIEPQKNATTNIGIRLQKSVTYTLQLADTGGTAAGGITFGTDTNLYRSAASTLKTDSALEVVPTGNPTTACSVTPTISTAVASSRGLVVTPVFTGSGTSPAAVSTQTTTEPSASIAEASGTRNQILANPGVGVTITTITGAFYRINTGAGAGAVTTGNALLVAAPNLGALKPTTLRGLLVEGQGAAGVTTSVGIDVAAHTGSTTNIGVRIAKGDTYSLQLSDTGGTAAGGIEFGTDTNIRRSAAKVLKVETILDAETGFRVNGAATAGQYLRGEGTNFVSATIKTEDLPAPTAKPAKAAEKAITVGAASPAKKVGATLTGDGAKTEWEIEHKLETRLIQVAVQKAETEEPAESMIHGTATGQYTWKATSASKVLIKFVTAPAAGVQLFINVTG